MPFTERLSEQLVVVGTVDPCTQGAGLTSTDEIDMTHHRRCLFTLLTGDTVDAVLCEIQEGVAGMAAAAVILTRAGVDTDTADSQYIFEVSAEAMAYACTHLRGDFTPAGNTLMAVLVQADANRYHGEIGDTLATVVAIATAN